MLIIHAAGRRRSRPVRLLCRTIRLAAHTLILRQRHSIAPFLDAGLFLGVDLISHSPPETEPCRSRQRQPGDLASQVLNLIANCAADPTTWAPGTSALLVRSALVATEPSTVD
jgi:hypothetical protein